MRPGLLRQRQILDAALHRLRNGLIKRLSCLQGRRHFGDRFEKREHARFSLKRRVAVRMAVGSGRSDVLRSSYKLVVSMREVRLIITVALRPRYYAEAVIVGHFGIKCFGGTKVGRRQKGGRVGDG